MNSRQIGAWRVPPRELPDPTVITRPLTAEERRHYGLDQPKEEDSMSKEITETQVSAIRAAWAQGLSGPAIATRLQLSMATVYKYRPAPVDAPTDIPPSTRDEPDPAKSEKPLETVAIGIAPTIFTRSKEILHPASVAAEVPSAVDAALRDLAAQVDARAQAAVRQVGASQAALEAAQETLRGLEAHRAAIQVVRELLGLPPQEEAEEPETEAVSDEEREGLV